MSGFDSLTATAPTDALRIWPSVTGAHVSPPSIVFHRPPPTAPKYASLRRPFTPLTAMERPPRSGPIDRHLNALANDVSIAVARGAGTVSVDRVRSGTAATARPQASAIDAAGLVLMRG